MTGNLKGFSAQDFRRRQLLHVLEELDGSDVWPEHQRFIECRAIMDRLVSLSHNPWPGDAPPKSFAHTLGAIARKLGGWVGPYMRSGPKLGQVAFVRGYTIGVATADVAARLKLLEARIIFLEEEVSKLRQS